MQTRKKVHFSALLATLVLVFAGSARGDDSATEQAKQHYETGSKQYDLGHWDDAIREYETAYELRPDPNFLYNLAQAYRRKGDAKRALDLYRNYLVKTPKTPLRAEIEERIKTLQKQIDEANSAKPAPEPAATPIVPPPSPPMDATPAAAPAPASPPAGPELTPAAQPVTTPVFLPAEPAGPAVPVTVATPSGPTRGRNCPAREAGTRPSHSGHCHRRSRGRCYRHGRRVRGGDVPVSRRSPAPPSSTRRMILPASGAQAAQWFCYIGGTVAVAAGAVLYYFGVRSARTTPSSLSLSPVLGPGTAGVSAMGVF